MSAGPFTSTFYEDNNGDIHGIRLQPETLTAVFNGVTNATPGGPATAGAVRARITGSRRGYGVFARFATVVFTATPPTGYDTGTYYRIAVPDPTVYNGIADLDTGTYLGTAIQVISKTNEKIR